MVEHLFGMREALGSVLSAEGKCNFLLRFRSLKSNISQHKYIVLGALRSTKLQNANFPMALLYILSFYRVTVPFEDGEPPVTWDCMAIPRCGFSELQGKRSSVKARRPLNNRGIHVLKVRVKIKGKAHRRQIFCR